MVSPQPLRRHNGPVLLAPTLVVVSPDALAAGDLRRAEAAFVLRMAGRPTVDCRLRCPRRPFRSPPPSGETRGEPDDGERGGLLLVCLAMLVVATRTSFVVALGTRARDRCTSLACSLPVASSPPAIRFRWKQHDRRGRTMGGGLLLVCCRPSPPRWFGLGDDAPPLFVAPPLLAFAAGSRRTGTDFAFVWRGGRVRVYVSVRSIVSPRGDDRRTAAPPCVCLTRSACIRCS
jgi:hypothetical protein